jgi:glycosyltransferase involved in cell wall biosynthesis
MRIGLMPSVDPSAGGIYQYGLTILHVLDRLANDRAEDDFILFTDDPESSDVAAVANRDSWTIKPLHRPTLPTISLNLLRKVVGEGAHRRAWRTLRARLSPGPTQHQPVSRDLDAVHYRSDTNRWLTDCGVNLMIYPAPTPLSFEAGVPYIMAIHDLQHRLQPEFPEVSADGEWERREYRYRNGTRCATLLLADSEVGKEDILNFYGPYGVTADQVKVLPFLPASYLATDIPASERQRVRHTYRLPERYLFYPAQFWPHKNHVQIVQALGLLKQECGLRIPVVFLGSCTGEIRQRIFNDVMSLSSRLGLEADIHYLGYVPNEDMSGLYAEASALVMPTFFGPTNIPVLEAWAFGCPVITSDIRGIREQVGDAGILVDPRSAEALADGICRLWTDERLAASLADLGRQRLAQYTPDDFRRRLLSVLREAKTRITKTRITKTRIT